jgi:carbon starvation protein CstA
MQSEPDGSDLDDSNQRGFVLWHYAGIAAAAPAVGPFSGSLPLLGVGV